eukprot:TRINITY_DN8456_c0_g1_i2.p1 TRINITY_DN8456_c0_g1~~TRINITY_DN8456_c0_g1_i2.p1  ORF type:complete len:100 (-),score=22.87 TRINITY_DN8456_c0_g1_i2:156-455(-)
MDACSMQFEDDSFDIVFDKGTLDSILATSEAGIDVPKMIDQVWRVLKQNGKYMVLSDFDRTTYFSRWKVSPMTIVNVASSKRNGFSPSDHYRLFINTKK